jgi:hypothetical protein
LLSVTPGNDGKPALPALSRPGKPQKGAVSGVDDLRVVNASLMPDVASAPTNDTTS